MSNKKKKQSMKHTLPSQIFHILLTLVIICYSSLLFGQPANYTARYATPTSSFSYTDNVLLTRLKPTSAFSNSEGFVMFKVADNSVTFMNDLIIHAIRDDGVLLGTKRIEYTNNHVIPIACAFNDVTNEYVVTGTGRNLLGTQTLDVWYIVLNLGLAVVHSGAFSLQAGLGGNSTNNTFVTDVCPVYNQAGIDFAFTGSILEHGLNTSPYNPPGTPIDKRTFIVTLETTNFTITSQHYQFDKGGTPVGRHFFPSRIIELPTANYGGFLVGGTGVTNSTNAAPSSMFFLRTDYNLASSDYENIDATSFWSGNLMAVGSMYYDSDSDQVLIAGSARYTSAGLGGFLFDKITGINASANIVNFSMDPAAWNGKVGLMRKPSSVDGYPKAGHITQRYTSAHVHYIGGKILNNSGTNTLPVLMQCQYKYADLMSWTSNQSNTTHTYPRQNNTSPPIQFYIDGYNYDQIWYPVHNTIDLDPNAYGTIQQALTGLDDANNEVVLNLTDNTYDLTNCNEDNYTSTLDLDNVGVISSNTVTDVSPTASTTTVGYTYSTITNPSYDFCDPVFNYFKLLPQSIHEVNHIVLYTDNGIVIDCTENDRSFTILNSTGQILQQNNIQNKKIDFLFSSLPKGIYFLHINNDVKENETLKFTVY